jgi:hypothetical protein
MKLDKGEELEHYEEMKYITLNNYLYFKEKYILIMLSKKIRSKFLKKNQSKLNQK